MSKSTISMTIFYVANCRFTRGYPQNPWFIILPISQWQLGGMRAPPKSMVHHSPNFSMATCPIRFWGVQTHHIPWNGWLSPDFWMLKNRFLRFCKDQKKWNPTPLYRNHFSCFKWKFADIFPTEMAGKKKKHPSRPAELSDTSQVPRSVKKSLFWSSPAVNWGFHSQEQWCFNMVWLDTWNYLKLRASENGLWHPLTPSLWPWK